MKSNREFLKAAGLQCGDRVIHKDPKYREWEGTIIGSLGSHGLAMVRWMNPLREDAYTCFHGVAAAKLRKVPR